MMNRLVRALLSGVLFLSAVTQSMAQIIDAIIEGGNSSVTRIYDADVDQWGNRFVVGYTWLAAGQPADFIDFDPNPDNQVLIPTRHHFVAKYSPKGRLLFVKGMEDFGTDEVPSGYNHNINVLNDGSFVISGTALTSDFDPGPAQVLHTGYEFNQADYASSFVAKYDFQGNLLFVHSFIPTNTPSSGQSSTLNYCRIRAQDITEDGIIVLAGDVYGTVDFDPSPSGTASFVKRLFLLKLDSQGNYMEHHIFDNDATYYLSTSATDVEALESGSVILTGRYTGTLDMDPGSGVVEIESANQTGCSSLEGSESTWQSFVLKLGSDGDFENGFHFDHLSSCGNALDNHRVTAKSRDDKLYLRLTNSYQMDLDPGPGIVPSSGSTSSYETGNLVILDTSLNYIDSRIISGGESPKLMDDFCLTETGFAVANQAGNYIDYTIGGNVDLLPFPGGSGNHFHILQYDENFNFVNGLISYQPPAGPLGGVFFDESSGQLGGYLNFEIGLPTETNIYSITGELIENGASNIQSSALISVPKRNQIDGTVYIDDDESGTITESDYSIRNAVISLNNGLGETTGYSISNPEGVYTLYADTGYHVAEVDFGLNPNWFSTPSSHSFTFSGRDSVSTGNDFLLEPTALFTDVQLSAFNPTLLRFNDVVTYNVILNNIGTQPSVVDVRYTPDPGFNVLGSDHPYTTPNGDILWESIQLGVLQSEVIKVDIYNGNLSGITTTNEFEVITSVADANTGDNTVVLERDVIGSFDPNDKQVFPREGLTVQEGATGIWLDYLVRFQNTGNDTAFNVYILDTLSHWLDNGSIQILDASDDYEVSFRDTNVIEYRFDNILLPDSTTDEPNSNGHIAYRIKMLGGLSIGDTIENRAAIYFDYNEPIITNTAKNYVQLVTDVNSVDEPELIVYPNPTNGLVHVSGSLAITEVEVFNSIGQAVYFYNSTGTNALTVDVSRFSSGVYTLRIASGKGIVWKKLVKTDAD